MPKYRRGSGSVYQKRGWYYLKFYANGEPVQEAARTKDRAEARRKLQARLGQLAEGRFIGPAAERVTVTTSGSRAVSKVYVSPSISSLQVPAVPARSMMRGSG